MHSLTSKFFFDVLRDYLVLEMNSGHVKKSIKLVLKQDLRTLDALQLAIASDLKELDSVFVCSDKKLGKAAEKEGMETLIP